MKLNTLFSLLVPALGLQLFAAGEDGAAVDPFDAMDDLLDRDIDDLKDLPEFKVPDTGIYKFFVSTGAKFINEKPAIEWNYTVRELVELADSTIPEELRAKPGDKFSIAIFLLGKDGTPSEMGEGRLKDACAPYQAHFGEGNIKKLCRDVIKEVAITAKLTKKPRKDDKTLFEARIEDVTVD
jgi:hypothetical protein